MNRLPFAITPLLASIIACGGASSGASPATANAAATGTPAAAKPGAAPPAWADYQQFVDAKDRSDADRALDAGRHPAELLSFIGVKPGMRVAELGVGGGYTAELLARAVGPTGTVYGMNNAFIDKFAKEPWAARIAKPVNKNIVSVLREFDDPLPPEAKDLDAVVSVLFYHDTFWLGTDRPKMNAAIMKALKPGGVYVIVDHAGKEGTGETQVKSLHRIEESVVKKDIEAAGFQLIQSGAFLREPSDTKDWNASPTAAGAKRGHSDRFALKFIKK